MALRIIAGRLGGRQLKAPKGLPTRPTTGRVRQALFDILGDVSGSRVLDLYAGSGALGIEALSRGAASAVFVEQSKAALACIRDNVRALELEDQSKLFAVRVERAAPLIAVEPPFDLVFADPPWAELDEALVAIASCLTERALAAEARVVLEHPSRAQEPALEAPLRLELCERRTWGDTAVSIFERKA